MTRDELIAVSTQELGKLPADELEIIARHFDTEDRALLAQRLAEEAEEMWSGDHEAPVPQDEWPSAHLQLVLGMHRDAKREARLAEQHRMVGEVIDGLEPARRALLCWRFHTTVQRRVVALVAAATERAMDEGLVKLTSFKEAAKAVIDFEVEQQIDEIEDHYYHGADPRVSTSSGRTPQQESRDLREVDPSTHVVEGLVSDEDAARHVVEFLADPYARRQAVGESGDVLKDYSAETELMKPWGFRIVLYRLKGNFTPESEAIRTVTVDVHHRDSWDVTWHHDMVPEKIRDALLEVIGSAVDAAYDPMTYDEADSASNVFGPGDLPVGAAPANDPPVREQRVVAPEDTPALRNTPLRSPSSDEVTLAAAKANRGELPDTAVEFSAYDPIVARVRQGEANDEAVAAQLVRRIKERVARGLEPEATVLAVFGDDYVSARTEAILLRQRGWDAIPLLLEKPVLAVVIGGAVVAVRDTAGRLAVHPMRVGTLNHLRADVDKAETRTLDLRDAINTERNTPERLGRFAMELWASARESTPPAGPVTPRHRKRSDPRHGQRGGGRAGQWMEQLREYRSPAMLAQSQAIAMAAGRTPTLEAGEYESWITRYEWVLQEEYGIDARRSKLLARRLAADTVRIFERGTDIPTHDAVAAAFAWLEHERLSPAVIDGLMRTGEDLLLGPAEPADCPVGARAFVVHQHDATRMHFDLRLELGGVLKCWTLPRVPELRPGERRLAIHVEDHPRAWLNFSGTVPKGYGAGTALVWDTGCWYADDDVKDGYQRGRFSFRLAGERLKGRYTLLRFRGRDEGDTWLLIRERDQDQHRLRPGADTGAWRN